MNPFDHEAVIAELKAEIKPEGSYYDETWYVGMESEDETFECVDIQDNGDRRWCRGETAVILHVPSGHHYAFNQDIGLTENQDNSVFADAIWRVEPVTKVVKTTVWKKVA